MGRLVWDAKSDPKPFPADLQDGKKLLHSAGLENDVILAYMFHLIRNQWFLSDFQNPLMAKELIETNATCVSLTLRQKYAIA